MTKQVPRFGPLTFGVSLGACLGFVVAMFGLYALQTGAIKKNYDSVLFVALGAATIGSHLGFVAELLIIHPRLAAKPWIRHVVRPITFCSLPYAVLAVSLHCFGYERLMSGFGF